MRNLCFYLIAASFTCLLCSSACEKKSSLIQNNQYEGTWKYIGYSGGFAGFRFKLDLTKKNFLQLSDSAYINVHEGQKQCGHYHIMTQSKNGVPPGPYLIFDQSQTGSSLHLKGDTLILTQAVADGMSFWYIKKDTVLSNCEGTPAEN